MANISVSALATKKLYWWISNQQFIILSHKRYIFVAFNNKSFYFNAVVHFCQAKVFMPGNARF